MSAEELAKALASGEVPQIVTAMRAWTADYRDHGGDPFVFADALSPLAAHEDPRVRQAVAETADLFSSRSSSIS